MTDAIILGWVAVWTLGRHWSVEGRLLFEDVGAELHGLELVRTVATPKAPPSGAGGRS
jgi:hypothetical protein